MSESYSTSKFSTRSTSSSSSSVLSVSDSDSEEVCKKEAFTKEQREILRDNFNDVKALVIETSSVPIREVRELECKIRYLENQLCCRDQRICFLENYVQCRTCEFERILTMLLVRTEQIECFTNFQNCRDNIATAGIANRLARLEQDVVIKSIIDQKNAIIPAPDVKPEVVENVEKMPDALAPPPGFSPLTPGFGPAAVRCGLGASRYAPLAPGFGPAVHGYGPLAPGFDPAAPGFRPAAPGYTPAAPGYPSAAPGYPPAAPGFRSAAPGYAPAAPIAQKAASRVQSRKQR